MYFSLYEKIYNENICFHYTLKCISYYTTQCITTNICCYYMKMYFLLYDTMYNKNICCYYILSYIMRTNISLIHESVCRLIRENI